MSQQIDWEKVANLLNEEHLVLRKRAELTLNSDSAADRREILTRAHIFCVLAQALRAGLRITNWEKQ